MTQGSQKAQEIKIIKNRDYIKNLIQNLIIKYFMFRQYIFIRVQNPLNKSKNLHKPIKKSKNKRKIIKILNKLRKKSQIKLKKNNKIILN